MYNRYIPQNDGSFQRRAVPESKPSVSPPSQPPSPTVLQPERPAPSYNTNTLGFLKNLLPKEFDIGDLIIVLLLLLMAGDCEEERNTALLTLALYFFM